MKTPGVRVQAGNATRTPNPEPSAERRSRTLCWSNQGLHIANFGRSRVVALAGLPAGLGPLRAVRTSQTESFSALPNVQPEQDGLRRVLGIEQACLITTGLRQPIINNVVARRGVVRGRPLWYFWCWLRGSCCGVIVPRMVRGVRPRG
jgi:hypothetical protein